MLPKNCFLAAIDLGSNSFRLEIDHYFRGKVFRKDYLRKPVRLGGGLNEQNELSRESMERGWACLREFKKHLQSMKVHRVRAVATQTLRIAVNQEAFIKKGQKILGFPIEVISGQEEALLIYAGVTALLDQKEQSASDEKRLVIDIGGRSTETIIGQAMQPVAAESSPIGSVGLSLEFFNDGRFESAQFEQAIAKAQTHFTQTKEKMVTTAGGELGWDKAYGSSGTIGAVSSVLKSSKITDGRITREGVAWMYNQLIRARYIEALKMPKLGDRQDVVGGGLAIIMALFNTFEKLDELFPARGALRQGVVYDMIAKENAEKS